MKLKWLCLVPAGTENLGTLMSMKTGLKIRQRNYVHCSGYCNKEQNEITRQYTSPNGSSLSRFTHQLHPDATMNLPESVRSVVDFPRGSCSPVGMVINHIAASKIFM